MTKLVYHQGAILIVGLGLIMLISGTTADTTPVVVTNATEPVTESNVVDNGPTAGVVTDPPATQLISTATAPATATATVTHEIPRDVTNGKNKTTLHIGGFYSSGNRWDGTGIVPIAQLAVDHVNEDPRILEGYELKVIWKDTMCYSADAVWAFHRHLVEEPTKLMLLGPACSSESATVTEVAERGNLVTLSYSAASDQFLDKKAYPYFFRTYKSENAFNDPTRWLLDQRFNWTRIGTFIDNHDVFVLKANDLFVKLQEVDIDHTDTIFSSTVTDQQIKTAKAQDLRIFIASLYEDQARELFCLIYNNTMYGEGYAWILPGWFGHKWWWTGSPVDGCTTEQIATAVEESFYISTELLYFTETPDEITVAGITGNEYIAQVEQLDLRNVTLSDIEPFAYDAVWALALALNQSAEVLAKDGMRLEDFDYDNKEIGEVILRSINSTEFLGMTGPVEFPFGDKYGTTVIEQLQGFCPDGWDLYDATLSCYRYVDGDIQGRQTAQAYCKNLSFVEQPSSRQAYLASTVSSDEVEFLTQMRPENEWYDLRYDYDNGHIYWADDKGNQLPVDADGIPTDCNTTGVKGRHAVEKCKASRDFICKSRADFREFQILTLTADGDGISGEPKAQESEFKWPNGNVPMDRTPARQDGLNLPMFIIIAAFASLGMVCAVVFLAFNIKARNQRYVKLSSPQLNNLIIIGCILVYLSVFIMGSEVVRIGDRPTAAPWFCMTRVWLLSLGFVLGYGAILSKTWRVYKVAVIRNGLSAQRIKITDSQLFKIVGVLLLIDGIILLIWTVTDPFHHEKKVDPKLSLERYVCSSKHSILWGILLMFYKAILLVFGIFLAWQTRKTHIPALNDSKLIGFCIYNTALLSVIGVGVSVLLADNQGVQHTFSALIIVFCATFTLVVVFVPKMVHLKKHPNGDPTMSTSSVFTRSTVASISSLSLHPSVQEMGMRTGSKDTVIYNNDEMSIVEEVTSPATEVWGSVYLGYDNTPKKANGDGRIDEKNPPRSPEDSQELSDDVFPAEEAEE